MDPPNQDKSAYKEQRLILALQDVQSSRIKSAAAAARIHDVPVSTLRDRLKGRVARQASAPKSRKLTDIEESVLIRHILELDERGMPATQEVIRDMANTLLAERTKSTSVAPETVGKNWVANFISRRPELKSKYIRKYDYRRAKCEDPKVIREWFDLVQGTIAKYGILAEDIFNFDETGFMMGVIATAKVITGSEKAGKPFFTQPGNREWVTVIECINTAGWAIPPQVILKGEYHMSTWYKETNLPRDWTISVSENGWTNNQLGYTWLTDVFDNYTRNRRKGRYRLLILDGHKSHETSEFRKYCQDKDIIALTMPAHSSHLLQPLDVGCFAPLKKLYGDSVQGQMRLSINHIDKAEFLELYKSIRTKALSPGNIHSGFAATGLVPYNAKRVLSKLKVRIQTPTPPLEDTNTAWTSKTPYNLTELGRQVGLVKGFIRGRTQSPPSPMDLALNQLVKGCEIAFQGAALMITEQTKLRAENSKQKRKRAQPRLYIAKGGSLTVEEGIRQSENAGGRALSTAEEAEPEPKRRAPSKCSMCKSLEHNARTCLERIRDN